MRSFRIVCLTGALLLLSMVSAFAKPFESRQEGAGVFVGEVACYGEHSIKQEYLNDFKLKLQENLQGAQTQGKIHLVGNHAIDGGDSGEAALLKKIHMDAVARGPLFEKDFANAEMIRYAEGVLGEDYFWDEDKLKNRRKTMAGKPYRISQEAADAAQALGAKYGADYLLFCNVTDADVELATSIFNADTSKEERAKHIKMDTNVYLVSAKTGQVYEAHIPTEKTGRIQNLFGQYGKAMTVDQLLQAMFDMQAKKIVKDVCANGTKALGSH